MAGIQASFENIGVLIASLYPAFIVGFLVLASIFNFNYTGFVYIFGLLITFFACWLVALTGILPERPSDSSPSCDLFSAFSYNMKGPSFPAAISWFTFMYLLLPTIPPARPTPLLNPMVIASTSFFALINMLYQFRHKCSSLNGLLLGMVIGLAFGTGWFFIWWGRGFKELLFYNELVSNNVICSRPAKQTFKCQVYKGGEIISSTVV